MITLKNSNLYVEILEDCGFTVSQIYYKNRPILHFPYQEKEYKENPSLAGIPFLYPFANRLSKNEFFLENKRIQIEKQHSFFDGNQQPLHGYFLKTNLWNLIHKTDNTIVARIRFEPSFKLYTMFPFLHTIEYKIELNDRQIHFYIKIKPEEKIPLSFGFHPYFLLREEKSKTQILLPAKKYIITNEFLIPTGEFLSIEEFFRRNSIDYSISQEGYIFDLNHFFDDGFTEFIYQKQYNQIRLNQKEYNLSIFMDPFYKVCQIYSPIDVNFVCIEPMISPTNAFISKTYQVLTEEKTFHYYIEIN
jgi:aldose 1-epimerase